MRACTRTISPGRRRRRRCRRRRTRAWFSSTRTYPEIGVPEPHHPLTHNGGNPEKLAQVARINAFHVSLFGYFLQKLKSTTDGNGSLLDHSIYLYGSGMGNPDKHDHVNLP